MGIPLFLSQISIPAFFTWVAHSLNATYVAVGIVLVLFIVALGIFSYSLAKMRADVKRLRTFIDEGHLKLLIESKLYPGPSTESALDTALATAGLASGSPVARRFDRFRAGLKPLQVGPLERAVYATEPSSDVFDFSRMLKESMYIKLFQAFPNILLGIGLLFTFLGLTIALYLATQGAASRDLGQTQAAIRDLLNAASFKFVSSFFALLCSIVFLGCEKLWIGRVERRLLRVVDTLERAFPTATSAAILYEMAQEWYVERNAKALVSGLTGIDFAQSFNDAVETVLIPKLIETIGRIEEAVAKIGQRMNSAHDQVLKDLVNDVGSTLERTVGDSFARVGRAADDVTSTLVQRLSDLGALFDRIRALAADIETRSAAGVSTFGELLETLHAATADLQLVVRRFPQVTDSLTKVVDTFQQSADALSRSVQDARAARDDGRQWWAPARDVIARSLDRGAQNTHAEIGKTTHHLEVGRDTNHVEVSRDTDYVKVDRDVPPQTAFDRGRSRAAVLFRRLFERK